MKIVFIFILTFCLNPTAICSSDFKDDLFDPQPTKHHTVNLVVQNYAYEIATKLAIEINSKEFKVNYFIPSQMGIKTFKLPTDNIKEIEISHFGVEDDLTASFDFFSYTHLTIRAPIHFMIIELYEDKIQVTYERSLPPQFNGMPCNARISHSASSSNKNS